MPLCPLPPPTGGGGRGDGGGWGAFASCLSMISQSVDHLIAELTKLDGVGPDRLKIHELMDRLKTGEVKEVVFATNPRVEGEATAQYLDRLIRPLGIRTTRIARGVPVGSDLELADGLTLARSLEGRRE